MSLRPDETARISATCRYPPGFHTMQYKITLLGDRGSGEHKSRGQGIRPSRIWTVKTSQSRWRFGNGLVSINKVTLQRARLVLGWVTVSRVRLPVRENLSQYITSHPDQLSLAIPSRVGAVSTSDGYGEFC